MSASNSIFINLEEKKIKFSVIMGYEIGGAARKKLYIFFYNFWTKNIYLIEETIKLKNPHLYDLLDSRTYLFVFF